MVIENAERYGLSALHQLRGRVGRGAAESWCFLVSDNQSENVQKRLKFLCSTTDGFAVAQYDLETRGPGDFFGSRRCYHKDTQLSTKSRCVFCDVISMDERHAKRSIR